jgi:hypothetical protein
MFGHPPHFSERVIEPTLSLRSMCVSMKSEDHIMRYPKFTAAPSRPVPIAALVLVTALGGCVGYSGYPSGDNGYNYPSSHYAAYQRTYNTSYGYHPYYSPDYARYNDTYNYSRGSSGN